MGAIDLAKSYAITLRESANDGSDFTNPDADYRRLFLGEDGLLHLRDSAGMVTTPMFANPMTTAGDVIYGGASGVPTRLAIGTATQVLTVNAGATAPEWAAAAGGGSVATDAIWDAAGDLAVGTGANTAARVAIGASGTILTSNGTTAAWGGAYASWTPTLTADGGNPTLGTGSTVVGRYTQHGKLVHAYATITFGSSGTAAGSGQYELTFPVTAATPTQAVLGSANLYDSSTGTFQNAIAYQLDTGEFRIAYSGTALIVTDGTPWAWAANDVIQVALTYEAA